MMNRRTIGKTRGNNNNAIGSFNTDHHSGWNKVEQFQQVEIDENKQMTVFDGLTNLGTLTIKGQLILK